MWTINCCINFVFIKSITKSSHFCVKIIYGFPEARLFHGRAVRRWPFVAPVRLCFFLSIFRNSFNAGISAVSAAPCSLCNSEIHWYIYSRCVYDLLKGTYICTKQPSAVCCRYVRDKHIALFSLLILRIIRSTTGYCCCWKQHNTYLRCPREDYTLYV